MEKKSDKTVIGDIPDSQPYDASESGFTATVEMSRDSFIEELPIEHRAYLEIIRSGKENRVIELGEEEAFIGRSPDCEIHLFVDNVSRKHARILFRNEEYHIEDLGSTNGIYVNGIRIMKCILRTNDQIEIGGVKIIFIEEKTVQKHDSSQ